MADLRGLPFEEQKRILKERRAAELAANSANRRPRPDIRTELGLAPASNARSENQVRPDIRRELGLNRRRDDPEPMDIDDSPKDRSLPSKPTSSSEIPSQERSSPRNPNSTTTSTQSEGLSAVKAFTIPKRKGSDIPSAYSESRRITKAATSQGTPTPPSIFGGNGTPSSTGRSATAASAFTEKFVLPTWLSTVDYNQLGAIDRNLETHLQQIKPLIANSLAEREDTEKFEEFCDKIRLFLHSYEHRDVNAILVKRSRLLELQGLPQLFFLRRDGFAFPYDIKADAKALFLKWARADFSSDIMRGLDYNKKVGKYGTARWSTRLQKDYPNRLSWEFYGTGDLVSGQWWPILLACLRDGAHGSAEAGICWSGNTGARSVLISGAHYDDKDEGDTIHYCGTEGKEGKMSEATKALHDNIRTKNAVRVIRSAKLPKENYLRPDLGFRYDGTYKVLSFEVLDSAKPHHRFLLQREDGQDPIRHNGIGARPTAQDKEAYLNHRNIAGI